MSFSTDQNSFPSCEQLRPVRLLLDVVFLDAVFRCRGGVHAVGFGARIAAPIRCRPVPLGGSAAKPRGFRREEPA